MALDFTGDFELVTLDLTPVGSPTIGLRFVMREINLYQSIWNNQMTCDLLISDTGNLIMNLPLFGYETLKLEFRTPDKTLFSKVFRLHKISDRLLVKEREMGYILHFVTPEAITNLKTRVSKSYKGVLLSDIVQDLHVKWLAGDPAIEIEPTKYQHHVIIPHLYPTHAINWLCTRANSATFEGANYLYYQDTTSFRFVSLESRLQAPTVKTYLFQVANVRKDTPDGYKPADLAVDTVAAQSYTFDHHSDLLENMKSGMYGNELLVHSHHRKLWERYTFDYPSSFDTYKHLYPKNYLQSATKQDTNSPNSKFKLHSDGPSDFPYRPDKWIPSRISQLQQLLNVQVTVTIPGDSERTVGQVIEFNLPSPQPLDSKQQQVNDKYYMGRYLISGIRHKIDIDKYLTTMELVKDAVTVAYP